MSKSQSIKIGDKVFDTKSKLKDFTKEILNRYELNIPIERSDFDFICELLKCHSEYENKAGKGIKDIDVRLDQRFKKTRCFHIIRIDGTYTDFSYDHCINNDTSKEPIKMFKESARSAVADQIVHHLVSYKNRTMDVDGYVLDQKMRVKIKYEDATVDHTPPMAFNKIANSFKALKKH